MAGYLVQGLVAALAWSSQPMAPLDEYLTATDMQWQALPSLQLDSDASLL